MLTQLLPILALTGIFGIYAIKCAIVYLWDESMRSAEGAYAALELEDTIHNITPIESPLMKLLQKEDNV